ncbi:MAG: hypothetical protein HY913_12550 [Desulfomonile tiedjei]|nr:hypothetical protein [Desulfomonile tiedjei]
MDINILNIVGILILAITGFMFLAIALFAANRIRAHIAGSPLEKIERGVEGSMESGEGEAKSESSYGPEQCYRDCVKSSHWFPEKQYPSCEEVCGLRA